MGVLLGKSQGNSATISSSAVAQRNLNKPTSSAAVERVFSYLTEMDEPSRQRLKDERLVQLLFLVGNRHIITNFIKGMIGA